MTPDTEKDEHDYINDLYETVVALLKDYDQYPAVRKVCKGRKFSHRRLEAIEKSLEKKLDKLEERKARSDAIHALDLIEKVQVKALLPERKEVVKP